MASVAVSSLSQEMKNQLSASYAVLLLSDSKLEISASNFEKVLTAAKVDAGYLRNFANALKGQDVTKFFACGGSSSSGSTATTTNNAPAASQKVEQKKETKVEEKAEEEEDMDMGGLFD